MHSRIIKSDMNNFRGVKSYLKGKIKGKPPEMDSILERYKIYMGEKYIIPRSIIRSNDSEVVFFYLKPCSETYILKKNSYVAYPEPIKIYRQETQVYEDLR